MMTITLHEYLEKINELIDENRLDEAIAHCRYILEKYPRFIAVYRLMGKAYVEKYYFDEAADLFQRVLSAEPNDLISHIALFEVYKEKNMPEQALWHLERAFEVDPYNEALRDELRQIYVERYDDLPYRLPLTPGAAARVYLNGEMYQQAVQVLQPELTKEDGRVDLEVMLAEALWQGRDDQRIDAEEVCLNILDKLPDCIAANAILSTIWLRTGRVNESQKYLARVKSLTCLDLANLNGETAVGRAFMTDGALELPDELTLPLLEVESETLPQEKPSADWVSEVTFDPDAPAAEQDMPGVVSEGESGMHSYDWMIDLDAEPTAPDTAPEAEASSPDTDWFADVGQDMADEVAGESGVLPDAVLGAMAFSLLDSDTDSLDESSSEKRGSLETDWFLEEAANAAAATGAAEDVPDWLAEETGDLARMEQTAGHGIENEAPDWLGDAAGDDLEPIQMTQTEADEWVFAEDNADELSIPETETEIMGQVMPEAENDDDWLSELASDGDQGEDIFSAESEAAQPESAEDDEAWLSALGIDEAETLASETDTAVPDEEDWLAQFDTVESEDETPVADTVEDDWLAALDGEDAEETPLELDSNWLTPPGEAEPPKFSDKVIAAGAAKGLTDLFGSDDAADTRDVADAGAEGEDLEDWLSVLADEGFETDSLAQSGEEATAVESDLLPEAEDDDDWLSVLSGEELADVPEAAKTAEPAAAEIGELTPEDLEGTDFDEIPDWLMTGPLPPAGDEPEPSTSSDLAGDLISDDAEPPLTTDELTAVSGETEEFPDWIGDLSDQPEDENVLYTKLGVDSDILPDWMVEEEASREATVPEEAEVVQETGLSGLLASLDAAESDAADIEEFPDWLQETPESAETSSDEADLLAGLADLPVEEAELEEETAVSAEGEGEEEADAEAKALAAGLAALAAAETMDRRPEPVKEDTQWLDQLAEEGDVLSELELGDTGGLDWLEEPEIEEASLPELEPETERPSVEAEVDIGQDRREADVDDTLSWLEDLAAQQESPVEELPSVAQDALADDLVEEGAAGLAGAALASDIEPESGDTDWLDELKSEAEEPTAVVPDDLVVEEGDSLLEMEAELDDAMSWLDEIAEEPEPISEEAVAGVRDPELAAALDALVQQVAREGLLAGVTAVQARTVSEEELAEALDWLEAQAEASEVTVEEAAAAESTEPIGAEADVTPAEDIADEIDLFDMPDDPDAAVAWLEAMAASDEAFDIEMAPPPIKPSEDAVFVVEDTAVVEPEIEAEEMVEMEEAGAAEELTAVAPEEEIDIFDMPDDPDAAIAWLEAMAASDEAFDIEMEPAPIKASEDAVYVVEGTAVAEPEVEPEEVKTAVPEIEEVEERGEIEADLDDLFDMPEDPDEALAWFEAMAATDEAFDIEMEPAPIKPSEDAVYIYEDTSAPAVEAEVKLPEAAEAVEEPVETVADESEEAAGWLDALAAQPDTDVEAGDVSDVPDWMVAEADVADDLLAEAEFLARDAELEVEDELLDEEPFEAPLEQDVSDAMPAWFDLDADEPTELGQTGWLRALPEVDVDSWLVAEEEATAQAIEEPEILPETDNLVAPRGDTGELRLSGDTGLLSPQDDEFAVVEPDLSISYSIDDKALTAAKVALADGRYAEAADKFQELVAAGGGMMILIAELETAVAEHPAQPAFQRALGDAYMRNGQLQKALETYRMALDSL